MKFLSYFKLFEKNTTEVDPSFQEKLAIEWSQYPKTNNYDVDFSQNSKDYLLKSSDFMKTLLGLKTIDPEFFGIYSNPQSLINYESLESLFFPKSKKLEKKVSFIQTLTKNVFSLNEQFFKDKDKKTKANNKISELNLSKWVLTEKSDRIKITIDLITFWHRPQETTIRSSIGGYVINKNYTFCYYLIKIDGSSSEYVGATFENGNRFDYVDSMGVKVDGKTINKKKGDLQIGREFFKRLSQNFGNSEGLVHVDNDKEASKNIENIFERDFDIKVKFRRINRKLRKGKEIRY